MPPASRTAVQDAISSLIKFESHFSNGEIPVYSHSVWKELAKEHKGAWSAHNWYNNVKKNLRGIWTKASEHWNFDCAKSDQLGDTLNSTLGQFEASFKIVLRDDRDGDSWFECFLSLIEWTRLFEPLRMDNLEGKVKFMLPPGQWGNDLDTIFWRQNRLPCSYLLEGAEVDTCSSSFLRMSGNCRNKHCQSEFYAYANIKPTAVNDELLIRVRTRDTRGIEHEKVQPHLDETRKRTVPKPKHNKPAGKQTRRVTTSCSDSSSLLKKEPGNEDLVTRVFHMQFSYPFMGSIHDVSYDPYYTFYALPSQLFVYKRHHASTRSSAISIGVLNKCAQELHRPEGLQSYSISMYTIVIKFEGELFPVYQMLCENKRMETREFGMKRWLRRVQSKPKQVFVGLSPSLLSVCTQSINDISLERYIDEVFRAIVEELDLRCSLAVLKVDVKDLIGAVLGWPCLKSVDSSHIRHFYLKWIVVLAKCPTITEFKEVFSLVCIVSLHNYRDSILNSPLASTPDCARKKLANYFVDKNFSIDMDLTKWGVKII